MAAVHSGSLGPDLSETVTLLRQSGVSTGRLPFRLLAAAASLALAAVLAFTAAPRLEAAESSRLLEVGLTERVVADHTSGIAIFGYDPVAYFTEGKPRIGKADFETVWSGAAWRFANEGNLAAFVADPTVYAPQYGGYDAESVARGVTMAGDPTVHLILEGKLYLFRDAASRDAFKASPDRVKVADTEWLRLYKTLIN